MLSTEQCQKLILETFNYVGRIESAKAILNRPPDGDPSPPYNNATPAWCKCGRCRVMPMANKNKCCKQ